MISPLVVASLVALAVLAGGLAGTFLRDRLPGRHLDEDTKWMVRIGIGFLSTLAALLMSLIISAKMQSFDAVSRSVATTAAQIVGIDASLRELGPAGDAARAQLRALVSAEVDRLWQHAPSPASDARGYHPLERTLRALAPAGAAEQAARARALQLTSELAHAGGLASSESGSTTTVPLLIVLLLWLVIISFGINLFAPASVTIVVVNLLVSLSIAAAIFLILELDQPYHGFIGVSDAPLRAALQQLAS
ncbi:MAG: hypothetical protein V5B60_17285 [Accumulibacter sp.]|jgi:hypothetical protein|uniref:bestrophin-like domain n=1 Tax=Accumulibacter sp. TaxID=2053492 RepID=UPI002FC3CA45